MRFALLSLTALLAFSFNSFAADFGFVTRLNQATGASELQNPDGSWQLISDDTTPGKGRPLLGPGGGRPTLGGGGVIPVDWPVTGVQDGTKRTKPIFFGRGITSWKNDETKGIRPHIDDGRGIKPIAYIPGETPLMYFDGTYFHPVATYEAEGYSYFAWEP